MIKPTVDTVIKLHGLMTREIGGGGLRDEAMLDSAINSAFATWDGAELYPTTAEKLAKICFGLIADHPFVDGNKRIGVLTMLVFAELNGTILDLTNADIVCIGLGVAAGELDYPALCDLVKSKTIN